MTLGTGNKKQIYILSALGLVAAYLVYSNLLAGPDVPAQRRTAQATSNGAAAPGGAATPRGVTRRAMSKVVTDGFHPVYLDPNPAKRRDVGTIDPTLQLDKLTKVQAVDLAGGARNVFQFSAPPPSPAAAAAKPAGAEAGGGEARGAGAGDRAGVWSAAAGATATAASSTATAADHAEVLRVLGGWR